MVNNHFWLFLGSTEEPLSDAEYVAIALGLSIILVLTYIIIDGFRKG